MWILDGPPCGGAWRLLQVQSAEALEKVSLWRATLETCNDVISSAAAVAACDSRLTCLLSHFQDNSPKANAHVWHAAWTLLRGMPSRQLQANLVAYTSACSGPTWAGALNVIDQAAGWGDSHRFWSPSSAGSGLEPDVIIHTSCISACSEWRQALEQQHKLSQTLRMDLQALNAAIGCWVKAPDK